LWFQVERAVARIGSRAIRLLDLEKTATVDRHIQGLPGGLQTARREVFLRAHNAYAGARLQAGGQFAVLCGRCTGLSMSLVQQVLKLSAVTLETGCRDIRKVIGNCSEVGVLGGQTRLGYVKGWKHVDS
jgi:hypothetical protein